MFVILSSVLLSLVAPTFALPGLFGPRTVTSLDQAAFEEAQQRDATATRAFSSTEITVFRKSSQHKSYADIVELDL